MDGKTYAKYAVRDAAGMAQELTGMIQELTGEQLNREDALACMMVGIATMKATKCSKETMLRIASKLYDKSIVITVPTPTERSS